MHKNCSRKCVYYIDIGPLLEKLKFDVVEFICVIDSNNKLINDINNLKRLSSSIINEWFSHIIDPQIEDKIEIRGLTNLLSALLNNKEKKKENIYTCNAGNTYFAIDSNLNIYPCQVSIFSDKNIMGEIIKGNLVFDKNSKDNYIKRSEASVCKDCISYYACNSFCKIMNDNDLKNSILPLSCKYNQVLFSNLIIKLVDIISSENKDIFINGMKSLYNRDKIKTKQ